MSKVAVLSVGWKRFGCSLQADRRGRDSVRISWQDVAAADPDLIVVAPCGYRLEGVLPLAQALGEACESR